MEIFGVSDFLKSTKKPKGIGYGDYPKKRTLDPATMTSRIQFREQRLDKVIYVNI